MIHTQTQIDNLIELAIIQRVELKKLVESLPELRAHLSVEIERNLNEIEPLLREELQSFLSSTSQAEHAKLGNALKQKIADLALELEETTAARHSALIAERAKNDHLLALAEQKIAAAASALPEAVSKIVTDQLSRNPSVGEIEQLRRDFQEPKGLNPRGKWSPTATYQRLDLITHNGDSYVSNINGNRERPSRSAANWTLNAARGNNVGGANATSISELLPTPTAGQILGSEGTSYVPKLLVAGANITITESPTEITIIGDEGQIELQDGTAAAPSLFFVNDPDTGLFRPSTNSLGVAAGGVQQAVFTSSTATINGTSIPASKTLVTTTDKLSALAATTSAELAGVITDETGTGSLVFSASPTLTTPDLGTPSALVGTNITGTAAGLTAGNVTTIPNLTGDVTSVGNATSIAAGAIVDADVNAAAAIADTKLATISTAGKVSNTATTATASNTASSIVARDGTGNFTAGTITADLTGNVSGSSGSTTGNAATATALQTARAINGVNFDGTAAITVAADAGTLTGATLASNVLASSLTSVGTLSGLTVSAPISGSVTGSSGSTTGNAATATALATGRTIAITGDLAYTSPSFDGSGNVTAAGTLATVATPGSTGSSTEIPIITINAKGLTTSISTAAVVAPAGTLSGSTLASGVTASSLTSLGTITNLTATAGTIATTPSAATDIANKLYVDTVAQGLDAKASCLAATTANITLSGAQTIDGVSVVAGNRVLVKDQTAPEDNGIYLCAAGAWTRSTDAATFDSLVSAFTFIEQGSVNADAGFVCTADAGGTIGTTAIPFSQFSGAGTFTAGTGLTLTGTVFSFTSPVAVANGGTGLTSLGTGVATFLGTPSSANLAAAVSDETGTGALVFANSPTLVSPALGTPSSGTVTNLTGTASININGTVGATTPSTGVFTGLTVNDNSTLGSSNSDTVNFNARVASDLVPSTDNSFDLGVTGHEWRNLNIDGTANIDSLVADTADINGGTIDGTTVGATTPSTVAATTISASIDSTSAALAVQNTVAGAGKYSRFTLGNDASASLTDFYAFSSTYTPSVWEKANGSAIVNVGAGGISFGASAGDVRIFAGSLSTVHGLFTSTGLNSTAIGATTPSTVAATSITATGSITTTNAGASLVQVPAGTGSRYIHLQNDGNDVYFGSESSAGGTLLSGASAYALIFGTASNRNVEFFSNNTKVATLTSTGLNSTAIGATTPSTGAFTTLSASTSGSFSGAGLPYAANSLMLRNNGTGDSQLWALGPNTSTNGTMTFVVADSDGSATYGFAVGSNTGLAVTGALSCTGVFSFTGASAFPGVLGSDGIARGYASSALGLVLYGRGSTHDVFIADRNANDILKVVAAGDTIINSANSTVLLQTASVTRAAFTSTGLAVTGTLSATGTINAAQNFLLGSAAPAADTTTLLTFQGSNLQRNWRLGVNVAAGEVTLTPSTANGGTTYTTPVVTVTTAGVAVTGALSSTGAQSMMSGASTVSRSEYQGATSVAGSATSILPTGLGYGALCIVNGYQSGNQFADVVAVAGTTATALFSGTVSGSPAARTYTVVSNVLKLSMASGTYSVTAKQESLNAL
jgi:hypothetical protein